MSSRLLNYALAVLVLILVWGALPPTCPMRRALCALITLAWICFFVALSGDARHISDLPALADTIYSRGLFNVLAVLRIFVGDDGTDDVSSLHHSMTTLDHNDYLNAATRGLLKDLALAHALPFERRLVSADVLALDPHEVLAYMDRALTRTFMRQYMDRAMSADVAYAAARAEISELDVLSKIPYAMKMKFRGLLPTAPVGDDRNYLLHSIITHELAIDYDVYSCDRDVLAHVLNDMAHIDLRKMAHEHGDLAVLRGIFYIIDFMEHYNPLSAHYPMRLTDADRVFINALRARAIDGGAEISPEILHNISGLSKAKLRVIRTSVLHPLAHGVRSRHSQQWADHLHEIAISFDSVLDSLLAALPVVSIPTHHAEAYEAAEVRVDGASTANSLLRFTIPICDAVSSAPSGMQKCLDEIIYGEAPGELPPAVLSYVADRRLSILPSARDSAHLSAAQLKLISAFGNIDAPVGHTTVRDMRPRLSGGRRFPDAHCRTADLV